MTIFDFLSAVGGLSMFLLGMSLMGDALEKRAGGSLKRILSGLTESPVRGFLLGAGVTAVIQSSSAATVMVVGFVNSGVMTLRQAIYIIMGANVGTTVTGWLLSLTGIDGSGVFIQLLKPQSFTPILALIGVILYLFVKSESKRDTGMILLGFSVLMFGMEQMSAAVRPLANVPEFTNVLLMFSNPVPGVLAGALLTAVIQSSSASVGILQALSATGAITFGSAVPIIMGQNIGTCVTALLSSVGANRNAKRAALVHLYFNIIGTLVMLTIFCLAQAFLTLPILAVPATRFGIAVVHTAFNIGCTALMLPLAGILERLAIATIPDSPKPEHVELLDERMFINPPVAIVRAKSVVMMMEQQARGNVNSALDALRGDAAQEDAVRAGEEKVDEYEDLLGTYLVRLASHAMTTADSHAVSRLLRMIGDLERISDHAVNITETAAEIREKRLHFTDAATGELDVLMRAVKDILTMTSKAIESEDIALAKAVEPLEETIDRLREEIRRRHTGRLQRGECTIEMGFILSDLLGDLERIADHCSNIAIYIIEQGGDDMNTHRYLLDLDARQSETFLRQVNDARRQYPLPEEG